MNAAFVPVVNPMPAMFPAPVIFPALNPTMFSTGSFVAGGFGTSTYINIGPSRMQFPPPGFRVTPMFAASIRSGGRLGGLPPAGDGNGGAGGGNGAGPKKLGRNLFEAVAEVKRLLPDIRRADQLMDRIGTDIGKLGQIYEKLAYISNIGALLDATPFEAYRFTPVDLTKAVHFLARQADDLTGYVEPSGVEVTTGVDEANMLKSIFRLIVRLEHRLLNDKSLLPDTQHMIADVHFIFVRRGLYTHALDDKADQKSSPMALISTVLHLLDIMKRYKLLGLTRETRIPAAFLEEVKKVHGLPKEARNWALAKYQEKLDSDLRLMQTVKDETAVLASLLELFDAALNDLTRGLYLFSPTMFRQAVVGFAKIGLGRQTDKYAQRAAEELIIASDLGLVE